MKFFDRVKTITTTAGTGAVTCSASAVSAELRTLATAGGAMGDVFPYAIGIAGSAEWEEGLGTITAISSGAVTFSRTPTSSSNSNALVNFSAGTKEVVCTPAGATLGKWDNGTSARVVFTSSVCVSDADLSLGSTTFGVDQTAKINALLDLAQNGPLLLIVDGAYGIGATSSTTALRVRSNTTIRCLPGCGFIMRAEQLVPMLRNYNPTVTPGNVVDRNIRIEGGIWNANGYNQSNKETAANGGIFTLDFVGVNDLFCGAGMQILQSKAFAWHAANVIRATIDDFLIDPGAAAWANTDGVHFNGPCRDVTVSRGTIRNCFDDCIAFNADDAYGGGGNYGPYQPRGDIIGVTVRDIWLEAKETGIRLLSGGSRIDQVDIRNVKGTSGSYGLVVNNFDPAVMVTSGSGNIGSVSVEAWDVQSINGHYTNITAMMSFGCYVEQVAIRNYNRSRFDSSIYSAVEFASGCNIGQLLIDGYKSSAYKGGTYLTGQFKFRSGAHVGQALIVNSIFNASSAVAGYPIEIDSGATIDQLVLLNNVGRRFTDFVLNNGTVTNMHAPAAANFMDGGSNGVASTWMLQTGTPWAEDTSVPGSLTYTTSKSGVVASAKKIASDALSGNAGLSARVRFNNYSGPGGLHAALILRGANMVPWSGVTSGYAVDMYLESGGGIKLFKISGGSQPTIGTAMTVPFASNTDYDLTLTTKTVSGATTISITVRRVSDGLYLQGSGSWSSTAAAAISTSDTSIAAASGEWGVYAYNEASSGASIAFTNIAIAAAP